MKYLLLFALFFSMAISLAIAEEEQAMPAMHHLFDVEPSSAVSIPESFPLNKNKRIDCQTCHGIKDMKQQDYKKIDKQTKNFFREGPYPRLSDFCYRCHDAKKYKRDNIHKMMDGKRKVIKSHCLYCHQEVLKVEDEIKTDEIKLRLPAETICYGCHLNSPHLNAVSHQQEPDEEMKKRISAYEEKYEIILPLSEQGKIMCITCHSSHPPDVISRKKPAGKQVANSDLDKGIVYQKHPWAGVFNEDKKDRLHKLNVKTGKNYALTYQRIEKEILLRLPAKDGTLCLACHVFEK